MSSFFRELLKKFSGKDGSASLRKIGPVRTTMTTPMVNDITKATCRLDRRRSADIVPLILVYRTDVYIVHSEHRQCSPDSRYSDLHVQSTQTSPRRSSTGLTGRYSCTLNHSETGTIYLTHIALTELRQKKSVYVLYCWPNRIYRTFNQSRNTHAVTPCH